MQKNTTKNTYGFPWILSFCLLLIGSGLKAQTKEAVLEKAWEGLGGKQSWNDARYFMFSCNTNLHQFTSGEHAYLWDRETGSCRFEGRTLNDQRLIILFNERKRSGKVFVDDQELSGDSSKVFLTNILNAFEVDAFWLFIPERLNDPEKIQMEKQELVGSKRFYVLRISNTPLLIGALSSRLFVDTVSGFIRRWTVLAKDNSVLYDFDISGFKDAGGGLSLPTSLQDYGRATVHYPIVSALIHVEADKFKTP